jgi:hypothetical protein
MKPRVSWFALFCFPGMQKSENFGESKRVKDIASGKFRRAPQRTCMSLCCMMGSAAVKKNMLKKLDRSYFSHAETVRGNHKVNGFWVTIIYISSL